MGYFFTPIGERSIAINVPVFLSLCMFVCPRSYLRNYTSDLHEMFVHVTQTMAVARSFSGGAVIRYVGRLPVLCMTSYLLISQGCSVVAQLERSARAALGLAINCAQ